MIIAIMRIEIILCFSNTFTNNAKLLFKCYLDDFVK